MTSNNEAPLPFQEPAVPECGRDVSTINMPIDEHAEDQQSNVGTSQAEQKLADAEFAPSACNTEVTPKKQQKQERQLRRKRKQVISPLDAGTKWQDGQRVSTRIKSKPLEWWRGERMLYGRVHSCKLYVLLFLQPCLHEHEGGEGTRGLWVVFLGAFH
jgi:hypothetical protein